MVLQANTADDSLNICKMRDVLSNKVTSLVPHDDRYRYRVLQTDVILAPDQPTVVAHDQPPILEQEWHNHHHDGPIGWMEDTYELEEEHLPPHTGKESQEDSDEEEELWFTGRESIEKEDNSPNPIQGLLHREVRGLMEELQLPRHGVNREQVHQQEREDFQEAAQIHQEQQEDDQNDLSNSDESDDQDLSNTEENAD